MHSRLNLLLVDEKLYPLRVGINALLVPIYIYIYIFFFFHFGPYILISPLLVSEPINACYFRPFCQSTNGNITEVVVGGIKIL